MSRALLIFGPCKSFKEFAEVSRNFPKEVHSSKGRYNSFTNRTETATFMVNKRLTMGWKTAHKYNDILFLFLEQTVMVLCPSLVHCYVNLYPLSSLIGAFFAFPATLIFTTEIWKPQKGIVLSLFPVIFYSSLQTWFPDPSFRLVLGPVASISPKRPPPPCTSYSHSFCLISSFFFILPLRQILSVSAFPFAFQPHPPPPCDCLSPCLCLTSSFLLQQCFVIGSWSLTARELIENGEEYLEDLQLSGDAQIR